MKKLFLMYQSATLFVIKLMQSKKVVVLKPYYFFLVMLVAWPLDTEAAKKVNQQTPDEIIVEAQQWFTKGGRSIADFARMHQRIDATRNHPLGIYVEYWNLSTRLKHDKGIQRQELYIAIENFLEKNAGSLAADLLRHDWLLLLGETADWERFDSQYARWVLNDDREVTCHALRSRYAQGEINENLIAAARTQFLAPREFGAACEALSDSLVHAGVFKQNDVWKRIRVLFEANYLRAARNAAAYLPDRVVPILELIGRNASLWLSRHSDTLRNVTDQELAVLALMRVARQDPAIGVAKIEDEISKQLTPEQRLYVWEQIVLSAARELRPETMGWILQAEQLAKAVPHYQWSDTTLEWQVRTALRDQNWNWVRQTIERMPSELQHEQAWVYWLGRAYQVQGQLEKAKQQFMKLALQYTFYGKLAQEELGGQTLLLPRAPAITPEELQHIAQRAHFKRALAFYQLGLVSEGNREWNWGLRGLTDRQLLAAAEYALRNNIIDRSISAAERTRIEHDFALRFPSPYQGILLTQAAQLNLDPNWVYGLIRQESRFTQQARSSAGAHGLMQIMPKTAKWVAKKIGIQKFHPTQLGETETNIKLGTYYLKMVLDDLEGSTVLASAAYNAGPKRSRAWRACFARSVEGAIFVENIPFGETRDYVKKVFSNAVYYAALQEGKPQSLKARLGMVAPKEVGITDLP